VHEVAWAQVAITRYHRAACRDVFERVLPHVVTPLKENSAAVEIYSVTRASIPLCPSMPHRAFRVPSPAMKS